MTEETKTSEGEETKTYTEDELRERVESAKRGIGKEAGRLGEELATVQAELEKYRKAEAKRQEQDLEAKGEYEKVLEKIRAELAAEQAAHEQTKQGYERSRIESNLDRVLEREGVSNEFTRDGIRSKYFALDEKPEIDKYVAELRETTPDIFGAAKGAGTKNASVGVASQKGKLTDDQIEAMQKSSDPKVRDQGHEAALRSMGLDPRKYM